jgi:hypothetical protein
MLDTTPTKCYCSALAREKGLDPVGYAGSFDSAIIVEVSLPWPRAFYDAVDKVPEELVKAVRHYRALLDENRPTIYPIAVAPSREYSIPGWRRLMYFIKQSAASAQYDRLEYLVPEADYGSLLWAVLMQPDDLARFATYRIKADEMRDLLVCTHGSVDAACAKFGYPLYNLLRRRHAGEKLRIWRCSHFGGHVFAPTMIDLPTGHYWAYVEDAEADLITQRKGDHRQLRGHYRGWSPLANRFLQAAEREAFMREGWNWLDYCKSGKVVAQDSAEEPTWAEVRLDFTSPDGTVQGAYEARVEVESRITTITTTGCADTHEYVQYSVIRLNFLLAA